MVMMMNQDACLKTHNLGVWSDMTNLLAGVSRGRGNHAVDFGIVHGNMWPHVWSHVWQDYFWNGPLYEQFVN